VLISGRNTVTASRPAISSQCLSIADLAAQTMFVSASALKVTCPLLRKLMERHMLRFLSSVFKPSAGETGALNTALIEAASERAIDGTDPRLRTSFVSAGHLQEVLGGMKTLHDCLRGSPAPCPRRSPAC
jgi:hypothetical protein